MKTFTCKQCGCLNEVEVLAGRKTNNGHKHAHDLSYFLRSKTIYEADDEPRSLGKRLSGVGVRPDILVRRKGVGGPNNALIMLVERQEQNVTGTGCEKVANKIAKAITTIQADMPHRYFIVLAGDRSDLLFQVAKDSFSNGGQYRHERLRVMSEEDFRRVALAGELETTMIGHPKNL